MALHLEELAAAWIRGNNLCVRCAHSGVYLQLFCNHSCRLVSRRGMRSAITLRRHVCIIRTVTGWTTSSPRLCSFTSCCAPKEREIGSFNSSAFDVSSQCSASRGVFGMARRHALVSLRHDTPSQRQAALFLLFVLFFKNPFYIFFLGLLLLFEESLTLYPFGGHSSFRVIHWETIVTKMQLVKR